MKSLQDKVNGLLTEGNQLNLALSFGDGEAPACSNSYYPYFNPEDNINYWTMLSVHDICSGFINNYSMDLDHLFNPCNSHTNI